MSYPMPKKIQLAPSNAKWSVASAQSVLLVVGMHDIRQQHDNSELLDHLNALIKKAKALEIQIVDIYGDDAQQGMQRLGELLSTHPQLMIAGKITATLKQLIAYFNSVTEQICIVDDAILLSNQEQHIQYIASISQLGLHHMNTYSLKRLWALSAPTAQILSAKGILLAIAEQLDLEPLEIDPTQDLTRYGLDSVAMVSLVGLWRANGANIRYEDFLEHKSLERLLQFLLT